MATEGKKTTKKVASKAKTSTKKAKTTVKKAEAKVEKEAKKAVAKVKKTEKKVEAEVKKTVKKTTKKETNDTFAVIKLGGVQLKVSEGDKYEVEKLEGNKGDELEITDVLLVSEGDKVKVGTPTVKGAKVTLIIDSQKKDKKIRVFKYKAKSRYRKTQGHRALITRVLVKEIKA